MQNHFEIVVSQHGKHWFATAPRSLTERNRAYAMLVDMQIRYPEEQGFKVTMTFWETVGLSCTTE